jgi:hypothetical protein
MHIASDEPIVRSANVIRTVLLASAVPGRWSSRVRMRIVKRTRVPGCESPWVHRRLSTLDMKERDEHIEEQVASAVLA